jgi:hypothetical protein
VITNKSIGGSNYAVGSDGRIWTNPADYYGMLFTPGVGWTTAPDGYEYNSYYVNPHNAKSVYVFRSRTDLWRVASSTAPGVNVDPAPGVPSLETALEFDPVSATTLYEGKQNLYKSTDNGASWQTIVIPGLSGTLAFCSWSEGRRSSSPPFFFPPQEEEFGLAYSSAARGTTTERMQPHQ